MRSCVASIKNKSNERHLFVCYPPNKKLPIAPSNWLSSSPRLLVENKLASWFPADHASDCTSIMAVIFV